MLAFLLFMWINTRMVIQTKEMQTGRVGEHLAAYKLESHGIECYLVDRVGVDLWACLPNGKLVTLQVKTAHASKRPKLARNRKRPHIPTYNFNANHKIADYFILVALCLERILIIPTSELGTTVFLRIKPMYFNLGSEVRSIKRLLT